MADNYNGSLQLEGLDTVLAAFDRTKVTVRKAAMRGLEKGAMDIIADAKDNLRSNGSVVTGLLRSSGKVQKVDETTLDAGFFRDEAGAGYAFYVENGRRAGKMPPIDEILAWLKKKHSNRVDPLNAIKAAAVFTKQSYESLLRSTAFLIARAIGRNGTQPHPFFAPAVDRNKRRIVTRIKNELDRI